LLTAICNTNPDAAAWEILEAIAQDEAGGKAGAYLANHVMRALHNLPEEARGEILPALAEVIAAGNMGSDMVSALARQRGRSPRQLALALVERLPAPLSTELIKDVRPLLARKRAPRPAQIAAAAALLRTTGNEGPEAKKIVNALISRCGKARA